MESVLLVVQALPYLVAVMTSALGVYKALKARNLEKGLGLADDTLRSVIAAIEVLPADERTKRIKEYIQRVASATAVEGPKLAAAVQEISDLLRRYDLDGTAAGNEVERLNRAAQAVEIARDRRRSGTTRLVLPVWLVMAVLALFGAGLTGCCGGAVTRQTVETVWPADSVTGDPAEIVIEWPEGVKTEQVITTTINDRVLSVCPVP